jgi:hypothetical protein
MFSVPPAGKPLVPGESGETMKRAQLAEQFDVHLASCASVLSPLMAAIATFAFLIF